MRVFILACLVAAAAAIAPLHRAQERIPGKYIVTLKPGANMESASFSLNTVRARVQKKFKSFNMLAVDMDEEVLEKVSLLCFYCVILTYSTFLVHYCPALKDVLFVEEDGTVRVQQQATWGLDRVDQRNLPLDGVYSPGSALDGTGVNVYIIDTGVSPDHVDFGGVGGRCETSFDAVGGAGGGVDCNGHGTHCAGTTSGSTWGVAKNSMVYGIRVLSCLGSGSTSGVVSGMDWVTDNGIRPCVASMSLGGGASSSMDRAVANMHNAGVVVSVAAGNSNDNACSYSPARASEAITVGATDSRDSRASFSNYGACVDIFAPGVDITSAWIGDPDATNTISGTSMACPHVSGAAALILQGVPSMSPADVWSAMSRDATLDVVSNPGVRSPNSFLYVP
ncbi:aqualysin-1-like [Amphiura filiformis]|uniref:aqualysin-1-like n=1 Tax=Amphiura filiformis TaxID=82378 RepID=UPI003B20E430